MSGCSLFNQLRWRIAVAAAHVICLRKDRCTRSSRARRSIHRYSRGLLFNHLGLFLFLQNHNWATSPGHISMRQHYLSDPSAGARHVMNDFPWSASGALSAAELERNGRYRSHRNGIMATGSVVVSGRSISSASWQRQKARAMFDRHEYGDRTWQDLTSSFMAWLREALFVPSMKEQAIANGYDAEVINVGG